MTRGYASGTLISGPQRGSLIWTVPAIQNKGKWLKNRGGSLIRTLILGLSPRVSYLDTGTLQAAGHLLGWGLPIYSGEDMNFYEEGQALLTG